MSSNWLQDIKKMHLKYGHTFIVKTFRRNRLKTFLEYRIKFLEEELNELKDARRPEDVVDALIDLTTIAIGTLDLFEVDVQQAWDKVYDANMEKIKGKKASRPNPSNMPDMNKPDTWQSPSHTGNCGRLSQINWN